MRYSYNSTNHCHVSVPSDSCLELRITRKKKGTVEEGHLEITVYPPRPAMSTPSNHQAVGMSLSHDTLVQQWSHAAPTLV